ncbi:MAG: hypothetical protein ACKPKO_11235 [Candidatus Fonsibacter sp.]
MEDKDRSLEEFDSKNESLAAEYSRIKKLLEEAEHKLAVKDELRKEIMDQMRDMIKRMEDDPQ